MTEKIGFEIGRTWFIGAIAAVLIQLAGWVWWVASQATQLSGIETRLIRVETKIEDINRAQQPNAERIVRIEDKAALSLTSIEKLDAHIVSIETYLNTMIRQGKQ